MEYKRPILYQIYRGTEEALVAETAIYSILSPFECLLLPKDQSTAFYLYTYYTVESCKITVIFFGYILPNVYDH